ncbi:MAG TPA: cytochrome D1 domain-containing protein [Acidimicrobiales bacterium]|nr:cytochrome D1 domain-containing protein [Acidimicrobiales bacterium]
MRTSRRLTIALVGGLLLLVGCDSGSAKVEGASTSTTQTAAPPPTTTAPAPAPTDNVYAATAAGNMSPTTAGVPTRVYVPNSESNTVDVIDPATFKVIDHFPVGKLPQHVTPSWDMKVLYADNTAGNSLTPIDPMSGKPGKSIPVDDPYNLYFTPDGSKAIVVAERFKRLDFRNPTTWDLIKSVPVSHPGVDHLDFSADGRYLLASCEFSGWVVKVDLVTLEVVGELQVGGQPIDTRLSPDGKVFYVANQSEHGVHILDGETMTQLGFIPTGKGAHGMYFSRDAKSLYVTNRLGGSVSVVDVGTQKVTGTWAVPNGSPDMGGVSADGNQFWVAGRYNSEVYVIDTRSGELLARIPVGKGPHGLAIFPQPGRYSLGHTGNYR